MGEKYYDEPIYKYLAKLFLILIFTLGGCSAKRIPDYPVQPINQYKYTAVQDDLAIAIHPMLDEKENKQYFGIDLLSSNIFAVFITAENRSATSSFILSQDHFSLRDVNYEANDRPDDVQIVDNTTGRNLSTIGGLGAAGGALIFPPVALVSLPVMLSGLGKISNAAEVKRNFEIKGLRTETLSPGESINGFVYFELPEKDYISNQWYVHIEAFDLKSKKSKSYNLPFEWERK